MNTISGTFSGCASRQHTKEIIADRIRRLEAQVEQLKILDAALPWKDMTDQEEGQLWNFFVNLPRP